MHHVEYHAPVPEDGKSSGINNGRHRWLSARTPGRLLFRTYQTSRRSRPDRGRRQPQPHALQRGAARTERKPLDASSAFTPEPSTCLALGPVGLEARHRFYAGIALTSAACSIWTPISERWIRAVFFTSAAVSCPRTGCAMACVPVASASIVTSNPRTSASRAEVETHIWVKNPTSSTSETFSERSHSSRVVPLNAPKTSFSNSFSGPKPSCGPRPGESSEPQVPGTKARDSWGRL